MMLQERMEEGWKERGERKKKERKEDGRKKGWNLMKNQTLDHKEPH